MLATLTILIIKGITSVYDILTYPVYFLIQKPWQVLEKSNRSKAIKLDNAFVWKNIDKPGYIDQTIVDKQLITVDRIIHYAIDQHGNRPGFGTREILDEVDEVTPDGKVFKKCSMGDYKWMSYRDYEYKSLCFSKGLLEIGIQSGDKIALFAETRADWMIVAYGAFIQNVCIVTLYSSLSEEALAHGINETEVKCVVTSYDLLPKLLLAIQKCPLVKKIICMEHVLHDLDTINYPKTIEVYPLQSVIDLGKNSSKNGSHPSSNDLAIIMYTSGTTGVPKGVLLTHGNLVATLRSFSNCFKLYESDVHVGYLPLAHVLELMSELCCLIIGIRIGYSSPFTLIDSSSKIQKGSVGDCTVLKPTVMITVPLILDRIVHGVRDKMAARGKIAEALLEWAIAYRIKWYKRGFDTPILHALLFRKISQVLGGRMRGLGSGGAPLIPETHEKIRAMLGLVVSQGYGLTETCSSATMMSETDRSTGRVGNPLTNCLLRLIDWEEGQYCLTDKPNPRGEIVIGGENVAWGYYKNEEKTNESFFAENGIRWFRTGDIGEMYPDGTLAIIDRKKDLVKLQTGEYVCIGKAEAVIKTCPIVSNVCIVGNSNYNYLVAIVLPNLNPLIKIASEIGKQNGLSLEQMCADKELVSEVQKQLALYAKQKGLNKFEIPSKITLSADLWTPDNHLVTAALKMRRREVQKKYVRDIERMYAT